MAVLGVQQVFTNNNPNVPVVIAVIVGSGNVIIEKAIGASWVTTDTVTTSGASPYWMGGGKYRVTPSGTATYEVS